MRQVPCIQQPPGSLSCLPAAILSVILWARNLTEPDDQFNLPVVSEWCDETAAGSAFDAALWRLQEQGIEIEDCAHHGIEELLDSLLDEDYYSPLVVTLRLPVDDLPAAHAVVLTEVVAGHDPSSPRLACYMDPLTGRMESIDAEYFIWCWAATGGEALRVRP